MLQNNFLGVRNLTFERLIRGTKNRIVDIPQRLSWKHSTFSSQNREKLLKYKNKHRGQRCFIVANGPSIKNTDLSFLKDEITIGMNRISLMEDLYGFTPTYLVVTDIEIQLMQFLQEYDNIKIPKFFPYEVRKHFTNSENTHYYKMRFSNEFDSNFLNYVGNGKSVTVICIQLAHYMGFDEVILIGKDHSYNVTEKGGPGKRLKSTGSETNHFASGYYDKGMKWTIPNYLEEEISYSKARIAYEESGKEIMDATIGGKLEIFNKVDYISLFKKEI